MENVTADLFLTPKDIGNLFGMTIQGVHKLLKENEIKSRSTQSKQHRIYPEAFRQLLKIKDLNLPNAVISVHLVKGGVGKTTLVHALASRASALGCKTLMIDLDQQANLTSSFGVQCRPKIDPTILDLYMGRMENKAVSAKDLIVKITPYLHIIPSNLSLANLDVAMIQGTENIGKFFADMFKPIRKDYDLIFIDCPPSLSRVTSAAHCFSDKIILPVNMDRYSLDGLDLTLDHLTVLSRKFKVAATLQVVINKFDARQKLGYEIIGELNEQHKDILCETYVSVSKQIDNSVAANQCIWNPGLGKNFALDDFNNLLVEILGLKIWAERKSNSNAKKVSTSNSSPKEALLNA